MKHVVRDLRGSSCIVVHVVVYPCDCMTVNAGSKRTSITSNFVRSQTGLPYPKHLLQYIMIIIHDGHVAHPSIAYFDCITLVFAFSSPCEP
jgi:hypothetical protein